VPRRSAPDIIPHLPPAADTRWHDRFLFGAYYVIAFVLLGIVVSGRPPSLFDVAGRALAGHGTPVALLITRAGTFPVYAAIAVVVLLAGLYERRWTGIHETSASYPSGHATLVIAFYGFWTAVAWASNLPLDIKRWSRIAFALWALAIGWSRLALGAHYLTDVVGGYLLGAAMASLAMIAYRALGNPEEARAPKS
jgi:membrane-associated phospholipid phosphatase